MGGGGWAPDGGGGGGGMSAMDAILGPPGAIFSASGRLTGWGRRHERDVERATAEPSAPVGREFSGSGPSGIICNANLHGGTRL